MTALTQDELNAMPIEFKLNGKDVIASANETIIQTAKRYGVGIPHLCYKEGMRPDGNCRACVVEVKGERVLAASCCRKPAAGMEVSTASARARAAQKMVIELLKADTAVPPPGCASELDEWAEQLGVKESRFASRAQPAR